MKYDKGCNTVLVCLSVKHLYLSVLFTVHVDKSRYECVSTVCVCVCVCVCYSGY